MATYVALWFNIIVACLVPLAAAIVLPVWRRTRRYGAFFLLGVAGFTLSQIVLRMPLLAVLQMNPHVSAFSLTQPLLYLVLLALSAGLVEELACYGMLKLGVRSQSSFNLCFPICYGLGAGAVEALVLVGVPYVFLLGKPSVIALLGPSCAWAGVERISATIAHVAFSIVVYTGVQRHRFLPVLWAIGFHGLYDFMGALIASKPNLAAVELALFFGALLLLAIALLWSAHLQRPAFLYRKDHHEP